MTKMFITYVLIFAAVMCTTAGAGFGASNPAGNGGIVYLPAPSSTNDSAKLFLNELIAKHIYQSNQMISKSIVCGPYLWQQIKDRSPFKDSRGAQVNLIVDGDMLEGKVLWDNNVASLFRYAFENMVAESIVIRKLNDDELKAYWAYINFDIQEPIFIVEQRGKKYVANFTNDTLRIFWFDDFSSIGTNHNYFSASGVEPITRIELSVSVFDLNLKKRNDLPDSVYVLLPFVGGNLFFTDRPGINTLRSLVPTNDTIRLILDTNLFADSNSVPQVKNALFDALGLTITPSDTKFGRFGTYSQRVKNGEMIDFGEMIMLWDNGHRSGFILCYFDRPCTIVGSIEKEQMTLDIHIEKAGFYYIGNYRSADGHTIMKVINMPEKAYYFIGIAKERQTW